MDSVDKCKVCKVYAQVRIRYNRLKKEIILSIGGC